ncbi:IQ domain-containing protein G [Astyanax mexicanus]|uniref:Dynein regulatory complex protein 9 n=1 Tax=Astyanax mexicanus TaxID=7994 RepID=A0A8B9HVK6_ASTMX|nr:IQ domain-containing protein G [Astyanax mexicanus]
MAVEERAECSKWLKERDRSGRIAGVDRLRVCAVLERCVDQLAILGSIMPDIRRVCPGAEEAEGLCRAERRQTLAKAERDRQVVAQVITDLLSEIQESGTFYSLVQATEEEKRKGDLQPDTFISQELRIKDLQQQLVDIQKEKTLEIERLDGIRTEMEKQLQQVTLQTSKKKNYAISSTDLLIYQGEKMARQKEQSLKEKKKMVQARIEEAIRVQEDTESFLKTEKTDLQEKLAYWMDRYEKKTEEKEQELSILKSQRADIQAQLQSLALKCKEMDQFIIVDEMEREALQLQLEKEQQEKEAATKIQAWWRGTLVRKAMKAKSKAKGGKKGKRKGKGKKK